MAVMVVESKYKFGDIAYIKVDSDQKQHIVTGLLLRPGAIVYELSSASGGRWYYDFEISAEKDELIKVTQ